MYSNTSIESTLNTVLVPDPNDGVLPNSARAHSNAEVASTSRSAMSQDYSLEKAKAVGLATVSGIGKISKACLSTPLYFSMGIARGFQYIPIAYGDRTVRRPEKVDGIQTGMRVAISVRTFCFRNPSKTYCLYFLKQFSYGFYDGISGVVTQPLKCARESGALGLVAGLGKGIGGLILKPGAGE